MKIITLDLPCPNTGRLIKMAPGKLFIGNLPDRHPIENRTLEEIFSRYGQVVDSWVARSPAGFGFITFSDERDAEEAKRKLDGERIEGSCIRVEYSRQPVDKGNGKGRGVGRGYDVPDGGRGGGGGRGRRRSLSRSRSRRRRSPSYRGKRDQRLDSRSRGRY